MQEEMCRPALSLRLPEEPRISRTQSRPLLLPHRPWHLKRQAGCLVEGSTTSSPTVPQTAEKISSGRGTLQAPANGKTTSGAHSSAHPSLGRFFTRSWARRQNLICGLIPIYSFSRLSRLLTAEDACVSLQTEEEKTLTHQCASVSPKQSLFLQNHGNLCAFDGVRAISRTPSHPL